jgi:hypothetical protein
MIERVDETLGAPTSSPGLGLSVSSRNITAFAIVLVIVFAMYFAWRFRRRCPYRNPLCRPGKPCLLCYRDLYKTIVAERRTG